MRHLKIGWIIVLATTIPGFYEKTMTNEQNYNEVVTCFLVTFISKAQLRRPIKNALQRQQ